MTICYYFGFIPLLAVLDLLLCYCSDNQQNEVICYCLLLLLLLICVVGCPGSVVVFILTICYFDQG